METVITEGNTQEGARELGESNTQTHINMKKNNLIV